MTLALVSVPTSGGAVSYVDLAALGSAAVGTRVRLYRKLRGLTQEALAAEADVTQVEVSRLENNPMKTPLRVFRKVSNALEIPIDDLLKETPIEVELDSNIQPGDVTSE